MNLLVAANAVTTIALTNARLWDGLNPAADNIDIVIEGEHIAALGPDLVLADGTTIIDLAGATVVPGLIDSHVHLSLDPGAAWRADSPQVRQALLEHHLRAYLACGVTTILDPAVLPAEQARIEDTLASGTPGPRYLSLGAPFSPSEGYPAVVVPGFPAVATVADVAAQFQDVVDQGVIGIKVTVEPGMAAPIWPTYPPRIATAIREGAAQRELRVFAHARSPSAQRRAMRTLGAAVMVHPLAHRNLGVVRELVRRGVVETTTLDILDAWRMAWDPGSLAVAVGTGVVPEIELATAQDPAISTQFRERMIRRLVPFAPFPKAISGAIINESLVRQKLAETGAALRQMRDAGVPIIMGSDAGNWPVIPYQFHGPSSIRELELMVEAGFTPEQALIAATRTPARVLRLPVGVIEVGKVADLVVLNGDPLADISALRTLRFTMRAGEIRTPAAWMRN